MQLFDNVEYDVKIYGDRGGCYLQNSSHHTKAESNNCFVTHSPRSILSSRLHFPVYRQVQDIKGC